jgi:hypothetical protein
LETLVKFSPFKKTGKRVLFSVFPQFMLSLLSFRDVPDDPHCVPMILDPDARYRKFNRKICPVFPACGHLQGFAHHRALICFCKIEKTFRKLS